MAKWQLLDGTQDIARLAADRIGEAAARAIAERGRFSLVLAGGTTPLQAYRLLATTQQDWSHWDLYYGDERCLPANHAQRNSHMVEQTGLTARVGGHYPIPAELGAEQAAASYAETIENAMPFDLVLLGMGEDGHTASLFPGQAWPQAAVVAVHAAPKPPPDRVSLSPAALQACRQMLVLVSGEGKREALQAWRDGADLPIARVADIAQAEVLAERGLMAEPA